MSRHAILPSLSALLLVASALHALATRGTGAAGSTPDLAADTPAAVRGLVFQIEPSSAPVAVPVIVQFLATFDETPRVLVVVEKASDAEILARALGEARLEPPGGLSVVEVGRPITTWSKDRYAVAHRAGGGWTLLAPASGPTDGAWTRRVHDHLVPWRLAAAEPGRFAVRELPFRFDGGDFLVTAPRVFVDWNLLGRNPREVESLGVEGFLELVSRSLGREVVLLGDSPGSVPNHHIGMYVTAASDDTLLVGDPRLARELLGPAAAALLPEGDFSDETAGLFDRIAEGLESRGHRVVRLPLVPWRHRIPVFVTFNNVVLSRSPAGRPVVHLPAYGIEALDRAAAGIYGSLGFEVRPVDLSRLYLLSGSLRCLPGVLR